MKKIISVALVLIMLVSTYSSVYAESVGGFTPQEVLQWLNESDENVSTAKMQAVNGAHRLAEMLVCLASPNADEEMAQSTPSAFCLMLSPSTQRYNEHKNALPFEPCSMAEREGVFDFLQGLFV